MLLGACVHAMLLYIVIYLLVFSVLIPLSAYVGRRTFHIYMHSVFDISIRWSVNVYLIYIITWCLPYVGQQPSTYMLGISSAWIFGHQFTRCLIPAYIGQRTCIYHIYSLGVVYTIGV